MGSIYQTYGLDTSVYSVCGAYVAYSEATWKGKCRWSLSPREGSAVRALLRTLRSGYAEGECLTWMIDGIDRMISRCAKKVSFEQL